MKTGRIVGLFTATLVLLAVSAQAATTVFYDDFDTYLYPYGTELKSVSTDTPLGMYWLEQIFLDYSDLTSPTNNIGVWYRGYEELPGEAWGTLMSMTNGTANPKNWAPQDSSKGVALKLGIDQSYDRFGVCNIGSTYNVDTNFTFSFRVKLHQVDGTVAGDPNAATGTITVAMGYADTTTSSNLFVAVKSTAFDIVGTNWMDGSMSVSGGFLGGSKSNALGRAAIIKIGKTFDSGKNTANFQAWADWLKVEANDPWMDHVDDEGLLSSDRTADDDGDGVDNFTEWATGGDPADPLDTGFVGHSLILDVGSNGTNEFLYITPRITDHWASGIQYGFERASDLVTADWVEQVTWDPSFDDGGDYLWDWQPVNSEGFGTGYDAVTNIFTAVDDVQFIRGTVDHPSYNP